MLQFVLKISPYYTQQTEIYITLHYNYQNKMVNCQRQVQQLAGRK